MLRIRAGTDRWDLLHPQVCHENEYTCPFTQAVSRVAPAVRPGTPGVYLCHLNTFGRLAVDGRDPYADTRSLITTSLVPAGVNGRG
jgi:hypothetical protein